MSKWPAWFLLMFLGSSCFAQVITNMADRQVVIDGLEAAIAMSSESFPIELDSPFREEVVVEEGFLQEEVLPAYLNDAEALAVVSQSFKPTGSLIKGGKGYLLSADGGRIAEGQSFEAQIRGKVYLVEVTSVATKTYRLRIGTFEVEKNFERDEPE